MYLIFTLPRLHTSIYIIEKKNIYKKDRINEYYPADSFHHIRSSITTTILWNNVNTFVYINSIWSNSYKQLKLLCWVNILWLLFMSICRKGYWNIKSFLDWFNNCYIEFGVEFNQIHGLSTFDGCIFCCTYNSRQCFFFIFWLE